jgi:cytoskeletal protein CcmA (bactofilin family)
MNSWSDGVDLNWQPDAAYGPSSVVVYNERLYIGVSSSQNQVPPNATYWKYVYSSDSDLSVPSNLYVAGFARIVGAMSAATAYAGAGQFSGALSTAGALTVGGVGKFASDLSTAGNLTVGGSAKFSTTLSTMSGLNTAGAVIAASGQFSGALSTAGALTVGGSAQISGTISAALSIYVGADMIFNKTITAYSPVAGEPSCGTLHFHFASIYTADIADTNWHSIDLSAEVPVGTKAVVCHYEITGTNTYYVQFSDATGGTAYFYFDIPVANGYATGQFVCPISTDRLLWFAGQNAGLGSLLLKMSGYYI